MDTGYDGRNDINISIRQHRQRKYTGSETHSCKYRSHGGTDEEKGQYVPPFRLAAQWKKHLYHHPGPGPKQENNKQYQRIDHGIAQWAPDGPYGMTQVGCASFTYLPADRVKPESKHWSDKDKPGKNA